METGYGNLKKQDLRSSDYPIKNIFPKFRRWEHVAFAFHIPDKKDQFALVDPRSHLSLNSLLILISLAHSQPSHCRGTT